MNIYEYNRNAWNFQSMEGCRWSTPFEDEVFERAKKGDWSVILTPNKAVPATWFPKTHPDLSGTDILALASGGGQQVPIFAAAGGNVTSFDASDVQLEKDAEICERHGLGVKTVQGDMADLSEFKDESFDLIFNPVSNVFAEDLTPIWKECARVLRPGGSLLCGVMNPAFYLFDHVESEASGHPVVRFKLPYSDMDTMDAESLSEQLEAQLSVEYSHSLETQLGGQCAAGLAITGFYEDNWDRESTVIDDWFPVMFATRSVKM